MNKALFLNIQKAVSIRNDIDSLKDEQKAVDSVILEELKNNDLGSIKTEDGVSVSMITKESFTSFYSDTAKKKITELKAEIKAVEEKEATRLEKSNQKPAVTEFLQLRRAVKKD